MLAIRRALINDPKPLMPDEPGLGLAPAVIDALYEPLREGLTILLAEQAVEMPSKGRTMPMCFKRAGAFCQGRHAKSRGIRRCRESTSVQRRGAIVTADCRAKNVPTTG